ncbi:MAG: hypothetical protein U1E14_02365 [Geminicoccaceae bacterium]
MPQPMAPEELAALVDTLIPGDERFPTASAVGVHGVMTLRWRDLLGSDALVTLASALARHGGPLSPLSADDRAAVLRRLELAEPPLFAALRMTVYLAYYEQPAVTEQVRALGFAYNEAPLPEGYALDTFDPAEDAPKHRRGHFVPTGAVSRVDLSGLDFLKGAGR